jgi:hypothetical protein
VNIMNKKDLAAFRGYKCQPDQYLVTEFGIPVWQGYADNANEAKDCAIENYNDQSKAKNSLEVMLDMWDSHHFTNEYSDAEDLIHALRVELAGKEAVIKMLQSELKLIKKDGD